MAGSGVDWYRLGRPEEFQPGTVTLVKKGRQVVKNIPVRIKPLIVIRSQSGEMRVLSAVCPHAGCTVRPEANGGFLCPCHGARFGEDGQVLSGAAPSGLVEISWREEDGYLVAYTSK